MHIYIFENKTEWTKDVRTQKGAVYEKINSSCISNILHLDMAKSMYVEIFEGLFFCVVLQVRCLNDCMKLYVYQCGRYRKVPIQASLSPYSVSSHPLNNAGPSILTFI